MGSRLTTITHKVAAAGLKMLQADYTGLEIEKFCAYLVDNGMWEEFFSSEDLCIAALKIPNLPLWVKLDLYAQRFAYQVGTLNFSGEGLLPILEKAVQLNIDKLCEVEPQANHGSPKQVLDILQKKYRLPIKSTGSTVIQAYKFKCPYIAHLLEYRKNLRRYKEFVKFKAQGVIPINFHVNKSATTRFSSSEPNLQSLEKDQQTRRCFTPSTPGWKFVAADYSQIELRILAMLCRDERLREIFLLDSDLHAICAKQILGSEEYRQTAKAIVFGLVYGSTAFGIASRIELPEYKHLPESAQKTAKKKYKIQNFMDQFYREFPQVSTYQQWIAATGAKVHFNEDGLTISYTEVRTFANRPLRAFKGTQILNYAVQGSASELIKSAIACMMAAGLPEFLKFSLQIHDELIFECHPDHIDDAEKFIKLHMEKKAITAFPPTYANVPTPIGFSSGATLGDLF